MSITVNLKELNAYAAVAAEEIRGLIGKADVMVPTALREESECSATNSLDVEYMKDLKEGKHLEIGYLTEYYEELAEA